MLRLGGLLHDFYVQPIETIGRNHRSDFVLIKQAWQILAFSLNSVSIGSKYIVTQMIKCTLVPLRPKGLPLRSKVVPAYVHMSYGNPRGRRLGGWCPTSAQNLIFRQVRQNKSKLILRDVGHAAPHQNLNLSPFWNPHKEIIPTIDAASTFPQKTFWKQVNVLIRLGPWHIHGWDPFLGGLPVAMALAMCKMEYILIVVCKHVLLMFEPYIGPAVQSYAVSGK